MMLTIRLVLACASILTGVFFAVLATLGLYRLEYVLNRMHAAAKCDSVAILFVAIGIVILSGLSYISLKVLLLIIFVWFTSPISVHMITRVEYQNDPYFENKGTVMKK